MEERSWPYAVRSVAETVPNTAVGVRAAELVGKHLGMFTDRAVSAPTVDTAPVRALNLTLPMLRAYVAGLRAGIAEPELLATIREEYAGDVIEGEVKLLPEGQDDDDPRRNGVRGI